MDKHLRRWELWRYVLGALGCVAVGWAGVGVGLRIPLVADASYGFHEFGHLLTWFLPDVYRAMMGSLFQLLIPVGLAAYFLLFHHDLLGVSMMLTWAGVSAHETSAYISDAVTQSMALMPYHAVHDWAFALNELGTLSAANELSWIAQVAAIVFILAAMGVAAFGAVHSLFQIEEHVQRADAYLERRPEGERYGYEQWARGEAQPTVAESRHERR